MATTWTTDADESITVTAGSSSTSNSWTTDGSTKGTIATSGESGSFTNITATGTLDVTGLTTLGNATLKATSSGDPDLTIECTNAGVAGGNLLFNHIDTSPTDSSVIGTIQFNGYNDASTQESLTYGSIAGLTSDITDGTEAGKMTFNILTKDAGGTGSGVETALILEGSDTNDEVDVTIGAGLLSMTTVSGDLTVSGADIVIGPDADGTDRTVTFGHSTLKSIMGIDDSADRFVINTDASFDGTIANNDFSIDASGDVYILGDLTVTGNHIKSSSDTAIELSGANITGQGTVNATTSFGVGNATLTGSELDILTGGFTIDCNDSSGDLTIDLGGGDLLVTSTATRTPVLTIQSINNAAEGGKINFKHATSDGDDVAINDILGSIDFEGRDAADNYLDYADIYSQVHDPADGAEKGKLTLRVVTKSAIEPGLVMNGSAMPNRVDVTIANNSLSQTTVSGNLNIVGNAGFTQQTVTFNTSETTVDFTTGNKQLLTLTNNIADVVFKFPAYSGNFLCIFLQNGTGGWDVTNWKTKDSEGNAGAGNSGVVKWAAGTATTLTEAANSTDIISIYWDATNEIAYAVASEAFA